MATIIIVEDHAISRQMLGNLLEYKGHRVLEAADGVEALVLARRERPDLIITDVVMPKIDGLELVKKLRADPELARTPALFYTAASLRPGAPHLEAFGSCRILPKPSDPAIILQTVDEVLGVVPAGAIPKPAAGAAPTGARLGRQRGTELRLAVLVDLGFHLVNQRDPAALLNTFCRALRELLNCRRSMVVIDADGPDEAQEYTGGDATEAWPSRSMPEPATLERLRARSSPVRWQVSPGGPEGSDSVESVLAAPFATPSRTYGCFILAERKDGVPFYEEDEEMAVALGAQTAFAYENILLLGKLQKQSGELQLSEERLRLLVEGVKDYAIVMLDNEGRLVSWNRGAEELTGWRADEVLGRHYSCLFPPDKSAMAKARHELEIAGTTGQYREVGERVRKDGSRFWAELTVDAVHDAAGALRGFAKVLRDVSQRRQWEEERARYTGELEAVFAAMPDGIVLCDLDGRMVRANEPARALFGVDPIGLDLATLGKHLSARYVDGREMVVTDLPIPRALRGESCYGERFVLTTAAGREIVVETAAVPLRVAGQIVGAVALWHDITDLVRGQEALREADRQKNQFLGLLSHELRNPLAPIRNSLFILEHAAPGGEQALRAKTVIDRQVTHMTRLVDDLLDVTRISRGKVQLQRERMDVCDVARRTAEDHRSMVVSHGLELVLHLPGRPLWIDGDRTRVAQIIGNLLHNSSKFTEAGGRVTVLVEASTDLKQAIIRVRDTGIGIAAQVASKLFEPFTQADTTLDRSKGGLGLGLALVKGLVAMHGGTVSVESEGLGKGAEFTLRFPLEAARVPAAAPVHRATLDGSAARRVLVIEDNVDAANSLRDALELGDHTVEVACSGAEGIAKARAFKPDVVLCDIGLPGMDGYAVARAMRADQELRGIALVALTGYALPEDVAKAKGAGFDCHLAKPPSLEKLEQVLGGLGARNGAPG